MKNVFWFVFLAISLVACQQSADTEADTMEDTAEATEETTPETEGADNQFGEAVEADGAVAYEMLVSQIPETDSLQTKVVGTVEAVCQAKGCWMDVVSAQEGVPPMRVRFVDYGFFVPKDIAGRQVVMEGYAFRELTSVEDLQHYAMDAGKSEEEIAAITEPREDIKFLASGVLLLDEAAEQ